MKSSTECHPRRVKIAFGIGGLVAIGLFAAVATRPVFPKPDAAFLRGSDYRGHAFAADGSLEAYVFALPRPYLETARAAKRELTARGYTFGYFGRDKTHFFRDRGGVTVERGTVVRITTGSGLPKVAPNGAGAVITFYRYAVRSGSNSGGNGL